MLRDDRIMQIELGDTILNTVLMIILVGWGIARVFEVWLNVFEKIKTLRKKEIKE